MKQIANLTRLFLAAAVSFTMTALTTSCGDDDDEPGDFIKITNRTSSQILYGNTEQSVDDAIVISTGGAWQATVTEGSEWLSLRGTTSGATKGQYSFGVELTANYSSEQRNGEILITSGTASKTIYIIQDYSNNATNKPSNHTIEITLDATHKSKTIENVTITGQWAEYGYTVKSHDETRMIQRRRYFIDGGASGYDGSKFYVKPEGQEITKDEANASKDQHQHFYAITFFCEDNMYEDEVIHITFEFYGIY
jgi:hypothetical protein